MCNTVAILARITMPRRHADAVDVLVLSLSGLVSTGIEGLESGSPGRVDCEKRREKWGDGGRGVDFLTHVSLTPPSMSPALSLITYTHSPSPARLTRCICSRLIAA